MGVSREQFSRRLSVAALLGLTVFFAVVAARSSRMRDSTVRLDRENPDQPPIEKVFSEAPLEEISLEVVPGFRVGFWETMTIRRDGTVTRRDGENHGARFRGNAEPQAFDRLEALLRRFHFSEMVGGGQCPDFDEITVTSLRDGRRYSVTDGCAFNFAPRGLAEIVHAIQEVVARIPEWETLESSRDGPK